MFGLFKKKGGEAPEEQERPQKAADQEIRAGIHAMGQEFLPEELSVLAVTGPNPFGGGPREDGLWVASMGLTAWMEEDSPDIHREDIQLVTPADPRLLGFLRQRALPDFLIKFRARRSADGSQLLLLDLPQPGFDPDLKAILEEQKKPDSTYVEGLGTFLLNRQVGWYQADVDWLGQSIQLVYDRGSEEEMKSAQQTALALLGAREDWDGRARTYAAQQLPVQHPGLEDEMLEVPAEELARRLEPESLQVWPDSSFEFWFHDADYQWEHALRVRGTVDGGLDHVYLEG